MNLITDKSLFAYFSSEKEESLPSYAELQAVTNYSFLRGASHPDELFARARALGHAALGIVDHDGVAGIVQSWKAAEKHGVRLVVGCRLVLRDGPPLLAYPTDRAAWGRLCRLLTASKRKAADGTAPGLRRADLHRATDGLILILLPDDPDAALARDLDWLRALCGDRGYLALTLRRRPGDAVRLHRLAEMARAAGVADVVTGDVLYHEPARAMLQDVLTCIRTGCTIDELGQGREAYADRHLKSPAEMAVLYAAHPAALARTREIAARCTFSPADLRYQYPEESDDPSETPQDRLERLARAALRDRYPAGAPDPVRRQVEYELGLIRDLHYAPYFLTVHTIVRQARSQGILCQGRGSAANSAVCFVLGITEIDPASSNLLFERFVSAERQEPPDIDVDFESERREEVIQWIYRRYGRDRAALCATTMRYRARGALRDVGKVLGLPADVTGLLSTHLGALSFDEDAFHERARELGLNLRNRRLLLTLQLAGELIGFPRQLGTHPGGFVLTRDRLDDLVPIQPAAMDDRQIIVWDKDDIDTLRFMKVDVLGLGMLGCMRRAFDMLEDHYGKRLTLSGIPPGDADTYAMISRADTIGTFQIESRAQMAMLPRMKPREFYDLVIQVAIVRPGPIQGDMVHPYLQRRADRSLVDYPSPELRDILHKTLGVPLFQEQAMQIAIRCAGFTPGEADALRRAMGTFRGHGTVTYFRDRLIDGMMARHYPRDFAERIFRQLEGFGSYGFPESHAASFALIAYASSWMKCHYPDVFCAALLNSQPMGFYRPAQIVRDARNHGVTVHPVCVNASRWDCTLERAPGRSTAVRLGLRMVKGLSNTDAARLVASRMPPYDGIEDVWRRSGLGPDALECLAQADAFHALGRDRRAALWDIKGLAESPLPLFAAADRGLNRPLPECVEPSVPLTAMTEGQEVVEDYHATGLTLRRHPVAFLRDGLRDRGMIACADLRALRDGRRVVVPGLVLMRQRPGTAQGVLFMTIEDETGMANLVLWKDRIAAQRRIVLSASLLACHGRLQREGEVIHVITEHLEDLTPLLSEIGRADLRAGMVPVIPARDFR
ncbi:error-prone DNA polymerase [Gluconacetobacter diazotrophicus]|uniref:Error-prone DNA polymerase n=1 Tax=Gluconacetobacter diazotrophicus (strain ATCC 49037 / DSM 5601 / CCUG 37298 / CIP 103539 / LMG 7603 / PAl5) TaxID=272568 RepID=A9H960_GLUDA|nr:error-prone DNA polymerase [Gluconacetobacter diazotrophicus]TWB07612.1 DNA polymerase III alpha subunit /DnaE-like error-prone DNA polymerase [Gluconacetobacter diazotrophicus]CAP54621.1 putative Error-prone DNA polymerase [Gluconacetobacter diazotrophicus PA1 5]